MKKFSPAMKTIKLESLFHQGKNQIKIEFEYNQELIDQVKQIDGRIWSNTHKCWYVENNPQNLKSIFRIFKGKAWIDSTGIFRKESPDVIPKINYKGKDDILNSKGLSPRPNSKYSIKIEIPEEYENLLKRRRYSPNTIRAYVSLFREFIIYFPDRRVETA